DYTTARVMKRLLTVRCRSYHRVVIPDGASAAIPCQSPVRRSKVRPVQPTIAAAPSRRNGIAGARVAAVLGRLVGAGCAVRRGSRFGSARGTGDACDRG